MTIPTDFGDITPAADATTTYPIPGLVSFGMDAAGTQTPVAINLAPGATLLMETAYTDAQVAAFLLAFAQRYGLGHPGPGGFPQQGTLQKDAVTTVCTAE
jgi:hypothetical protein